MTLVVRKIVADGIVARLQAARPPWGNPKARRGLNYDLFPRDEFATPVARAGRPATSRPSATGRSRTPSAISFPSSLECVGTRSRATRYDLKAVKWTHKLSERQRAWTRG